METNILLALAQKGIPGAITVLTSSLNGDMGDVMIDLVRALNSARASGQVQMVLTGFVLEWDTAIVTNLQSLFDGLALEGERFTVGQPRLLNQKTARIDITRTGPEQSAESAPPASTDAIGRMTAEQMKLLVRPLVDFLAEMSEDASSEERPLITRLRHAVLNDGVITHVWHACELGPRALHQKNRLGRKSIDWLVKVFRGHGLYEGMQFRPDERDKLVAATGDYE